MKLFEKRNLFIKDWVERILWLSFLIFFSFSWAYADGSKDLYASGTGARAGLRSSLTVDNERWPFPNQGVHYVYLKRGETVMLASSTQSAFNNAKIELYTPSGTSIPLDFGTSSETLRGYISNRNAEQAGPKLSNSDNTTDRYRPVEYTVNSANGVEGIYAVKFIGNGTGNGSTTAANNNNLGQGGSDAVIQSWDVSVAKSDRSGFIRGRVYVTVMNMSVGTTSPHTNGFYGVVYPMTNDGYTYRVNNNGNNGMYFTFLVNNNGFIDLNGNAKYKSLDYVSTASDVQNPNIPDPAGKQVTHKIFYTIPAADLPTSSTGVIGVNTNGSWIIGTTWLKNEVIAPEVKNVALSGVEGLGGQVSNKGGYVKLNAGTVGNYNIIIRSPNGASPTFYTRVLTGTALEGDNNVFWDGRAGTQSDPTIPGVALPAGGVPVEVSVQLQGAEVHFPFIDMEYNTKGTIIELLDYSQLPGQIAVLSDTVFWNDQDRTGSYGGSAPNPLNNSHLPPANKVGEKSTVNGHIWGVNASGTSGQFGDVKSIDTWAFIKGRREMVQTTVEVKTADLMISEISNNKGSTPVKVDSLVTYTVKVKSDGPSDVTGAIFSFRPPVGFVPEGVPVFTGSACGQESAGASITYDAQSNHYNSSLDLKNGCEVTYVFTMKATNDVISGSNSATATIMRPRDVTDPDATNTDINTTPTDPFLECNPLGGAITCNNIKNTSITVAPRADLNIIKTVTNANPHVGEVVTFNIAVKNNGPDVATSVTITDVVKLTNYTIGTINNGGQQNPAGTLTWTIPTLLNGASTTVSFTATVKGYGDIANTASVTSNLDDPNLTDNTSTVSVTGCAAPSGQVSLTGSTLTN